MPIENITERDRDIQQIHLICTTTMLQTVTYLMNCQMPTQPQHKLGVTT